MTTMSKTATTTVEQISDDSGVQAAERRRAETQRALQEATAAHDRLAPPVGVTLDDLDFDEAKRTVKRAETADEQAAREVETAKSVARDRLKAGRAAGRVERLRSLLVSLEAVQRDAAALRGWDVATARALDRADDQAELPPAPGLLSLDDDLERVRQAIDGPRELPPRALAPRKVRVRLLQQLYDKEHVLRFRGVEIMDETDAQVALEKGWARPVERTA